VHRNFAGCRDSLCRGKKYWYSAKIPLAIKGCGITSRCIDRAEEPRLRSQSINESVREMTFKINPFHLRYF
jgi:hypothetical protein